MSRYIDADNLQRHGNRGGIVYWRDIESQPTANVRENVRAEKVISKHAVDDITTRWFECDVCGQAVDLMDNFCKNCGARFVP